MDCDIVVVGTGLAESVAAAALSKAGYKLVHIDPNAYYGRDQASLSLDEICEWADNNTHPAFTSISRSQSFPANGRLYSISLSPSIIPASGPLISSLISSGVSRYGGFKLLERVALYHSPGLVTNVPNTKEDIFKNKQISLVEKRRLMRFFTFAAGEFEGTPELEGHETTPLLDFLKSSFVLDHKIAETIAYALAFSTAPSDPALPALRRIRRYLRSSGRYGPSPFLVGHYGGSGELAQGFCRSSAVNGSTYILGRTISTILQSNTEKNSSDRRHSITLNGFDEPITCDLIISSPDHRPDSDYTSVVARCIAIIDRPLVFSPEPPQEDTSVDNAVDTAVLIFPPSCLPGGSVDTAVHVFVTGEGSLSAPKSRWILYLSMPVSSNDISAEELLRPYLTATISLAQGPTPAEPLFTLFYVQKTVKQPVATSSDSPRVSVPPQVVLLPEGADAATEDAEGMFREAVRKLRQLRKQRCVEQDDNGEEEDVPFWPPLEPTAEETGDTEEDW